MGTAVGKYDAVGIVVGDFVGPFVGKYDAVGSVVGNFEGPLVWSTGRGGGCSWCYCCGSGSCGHCGWWLRGGHLLGPWWALRLGNMTVIPNENYESFGL